MTSAPTATAMSVVTAPVPWLVETGDAVIPDCGHELRTGRLRDHFEGVGMFSRAVHLLDFPYPVCREGIKVGKGGFVV